MSRPAKVLSSASALIAVAALAAACGTERLGVSKSNPLYHSAVLFSQRCSGCHTLSYAATHGSSSNVRTSLVTNGPNFNIRCERPVTRVLYAIENGGFSGAIMPQNVVVGPDAIEVARFVATYAGRQAPRVSGVTPCNQQAIGTIPTTIQTATTARATKPAARQRKPRKRAAGRKAPPAKKKPARR